MPNFSEPVYVGQGRGLVSITLDPGKGIEITDSLGDIVAAISMDGVVRVASGSLGGDGRDGSLQLFGSGEAILGGGGGRPFPAISLDAASGTLGVEGTMTATRGGVEQVAVSAGDETHSPQVRVGSSDAAQDAHGSILVGRKGGKPLAALNGIETGTFVLSDGSGNDTITLAAPAGQAVFSSADGKHIVHIDGGQGDVRVTNGDLAEQFDTSQIIEAGSVVVLDRAGGVTPARREYDTSVVGVVAGAGDFRPGFILDDRGDGDGRVAVSLTGKAACFVDTTDGPIAVGDLLTTSATPGHAMHASDATRRPGAVVGKSLAAVPAGTRRLIPVLVTLN